MLPIQSCNVGLPCSAGWRPAGLLHITSPFQLLRVDVPNSCELHSAYADDVHAAVSSPNFEAAAATLTQHAPEVAGWAEERQLQISAPKFHVTLFTSDTHQFHRHPHVTLGGSLLPLEQNPKILGITFDPTLTFHKHAQNILARAQERTKVMKALAGTNWGQQKETLVLTFKALIWSVVSYAAPVWFPNISNHYIQKLQAVQNTNLRIATGSHKRASQDHLHSESKVLPVADSLGLLCAQYLASAKRPNHPANPTVNRPTGPRLKKHTLQSKFLPSINHLLVDGVTPPSEYDNIRAEIHTETVAKAIQDQAPNRILQRQPPPISPEEESLPRPHRAALSQLRSGFCKALNRYRTDIGLTIDPSCPSCGHGNHDPPHLFACPSHPSGDLRVVGLWERPVRVAHFHLSLPCFHYLPALPPPPPEPPPPADQAP